MSEQNNTPLTLPMMNAPELTMPAADPVQSIQQTATPDVKSAIPEIKETEILADVETLTPAERAAIDAFKTKLDITDPDHVMLYGADAQKALSEFSAAALDAVRTKDSGEVGKMLEDLVLELQGFETDAEEPKGLMKLFSKTGDRIARMKTRFTKVSANVENIQTQLEAHQVQLQEDVKTFDRMYDRNMAYFRQLTLYVIAGQEAIRDMRENDLRAAYEKAAATGDAMDAQKANDLAAQCDRFEKKLHDLLLTRHVSIQTAPQIRLLQNNDQLLIERIQSTIANTLPLWKNQMVLALGLHHAQQALKAQTAVTDMTNELLRKNAATLKQGTIETAREAERGIIEVETLVETNQSLIDTINEVITIQQDGRVKRAEAERTLHEMEVQLKAKLLETSGR